MGFFPEPQVLQVSQDTSVSDEPGVAVTDTSLLLNTLLLGELLPPLSALEMASNLF